ncbi:MAG: 50S ribosomal protein L6 [Candidatus Pacebacteria bacterium]|nr:50S ribosomal protein L6 [Candidatus Paceibacterota bacterium]
MSRIGKKIIAVPEKTEVKIGAGVMSVKGPLGELSRPFKDNEVKIALADGKVTLSPVGEDSGALWGTYSAHLTNMIKGVHTPFSKKLIIEGVGYKWDVKGEELNLALGFSHPVKLKIPKGLKVVAEKGNLTITGNDVEMVGHFTAKVRDLKKPEPYKGKGIRYSDEVIRRKAGKKTT